LILLGIEPWGPYRDDCLSGLARHASLSPWSKEKIKLSDLIPAWGGPTDPKSRWEQKAARLREKAISALDATHTQKD
jgi:hypothetical protein